MSDWETGVKTGAFLPFLGPPRGWIHRDLSVSYICLSWHPWPAPPSVYLMEIDTQGSCDQVQPYRGLPPWSHLNLTAMMVSVTCQLDKIQCSLRGEPWGIPLWNYLNYGRWGGESSHCGWDPGLQRQRGRAEWQLGSIPSASRLWMHVMQSAASSCCCLDFNTAMAWALELQAGINRSPLSCVRVFYQQQMKRNQDTWNLQRPLWQSLCYQINRVADKRKIALSQLARGPHILPSDIPLHPSPSNRNKTSRKPVIQTVRWPQNLWF